MKQKLIDLCDIQYGFAFNSAEFTDNSSYPPLIRIRDVKRGYSETFYAGKFSDEYIVRQGDLLVGMDGEFNIARWKSQDALLNQRVCRIIAKSNTDEEYLRFALSIALKKLENKTAFVTVKHLSAKELNKLVLNVPSLSDQQIKAKILSKIEYIISRYHSEIQKLDDLVKSRFIEMFGDQIINPMGWPVVTIKDIVSDVKYGTSKPAVEGGKYPYLRMNNLTSDGGLDLTDLKYIDIEDDELEKYVVRKGDVLFNRTNSIDLIGKTALFDLEQEMVIAGYIIRVRLKNAILPEFFTRYMNLDPIKIVLKNMAKGAVNQANINAQELQSIKIYLPDIERQKQFKAEMDSLNKSRLKLKSLVDKPGYTRQKNYYKTTKIRGGDVCLILDISKTTDNLKCFQKHV